LSPSRFAKGARRLALVCALVLAAVQLARPVHSNPPGSGGLVAPAETSEVLRHACYDCHSNETRWPWYASVAPLSWLIRHDVDEGRRRLNFSNWQDYASDPETAAHKLDEIAKAVTRGDMAPWHYRLLHPSARLGEEDRARLARWAAEETRRLAAPQS
jgi:hypothetical protein